MPETNRIFIILFGMRIHSIPVISGRDAAIEFNPIGVGVFISDRFLILPGSRRFKPCSFERLAVGSHQNPVPISGPFRLQGLAGFDFAALSSGFKREARTIGLRFSW